MKVLERQVYEYSRKGNSRNKWKGLFYNAQLSFSITTYKKGWSFEMYVCSSKSSSEKCEEQVRNRRATNKVARK